MKFQAGFKKNFTTIERNFHMNIFDAHQKQNIQQKPLE